MGAWDIQHDRDADGRSTRQTLVPSETERLKAINAKLVDACEAALSWVARNTPMVDSSDPVLGPIADEADAIRGKLRSAIAEAAAQAVGP